MKLRHILLGLALAAWPLAAPAQRQMEKLGRGVVVLRTSSTQTYISWRMWGNDPGNIAFNLYRSVGGGGGVKLNSSPLTATTDYTDTPGSSTLNGSTVSYYVCPVLNGVEQPPSAAFTLPANAPIRQYLSLPLQTIPQYPGDASDTYPYDVKFCWVGDLDGDGEYDFVVDRLSTDPNNTHRQYVEAYKRDGTFLWRINMGPNSINQYNIEPGSSAISVGHCDHVTVYDMDGDGKAEVLLKTANGVILGNGATVTAGNDSVQYISVIDGLTGVEKARATIPNPYIAAGPLSGHFAIMYADGQRPSLLFEGEDRNDDQSFNMITTTWDYRDGQITQRWSWRRDSHKADVAHQIRIADVDNDGKDEYCDISFALDDDGTELFYNELIHGDRFHIADMDPDRPGLETFAIQQNNPSMLATAYYDSATGQIIKKWYSNGIVDVGRGIALDLDPNHKGYEFYSTQPGIYDSKGNQIYVNSVWPPEGLWWDGDLSREFVDGAGSGALNPVVNKFNPATGNSDRMYTIYNDNGGVHQAYGGRPAFWGDILGDWREELVLVANNYSELRIYVTKIPATNRLYTLMHNPAYRMQTTCKGYVQASYVDYYLGTGMTTPPPPPMVDADLTWRGGPGASTWDVGATASWQFNGTNETFAQGDTVLFDLSGNNATVVNLSGNLQPDAVTVYAPSDYVFDGNGTLMGNMSFTKAGAGALTLEGNYSYTGNTTVWDGAFIVNGNLSQSNVTVWGGTWGGALAGGRTGGRLAGSGEIGGSVSVQYRGAVTPGDGMDDAATLSIGHDLAATDGAVFALDLSNDPTGTAKPNDRIDVTGNLSLSGTVAIDINALDGALAPGTYTLLTYTGNFTGGLNNFNVSVPPGTPYALANPAGAIQLVIAGTRASANVTWTGGVSGNQWDIDASQNWQLGGSPAVFVSGDTVLFDGTGAANATVNLSTALPIANLTINTSANYTLTGSGSLTGPGGLTKSGSGTLTIATTNSYTGPTVVNGGTLAVDNLNDGGVASSIGASNTTASNFVLNGGTLSLTGFQTNTNRSLTLGASGGNINIPTATTSLQISGVIGGGGALTKSGAGVLILAANNTYTGGTTIVNGTILLASATANSNALGTGAVTIVNGTLSMSDVQASETAAWNLIVPANATARLEADGRCSLTGTLTGSGNFTLYTGYVRTDLKGNWSAFGGTINAVTDTDGGDFRVTNTSGYPNATINLGPQVFAYYNSTPPPSGITVDIGALAGVANATLKGSPTSGRTVTWRIGAKNTNSTYAGNITNSSGLTAILKSGTGTQTLSGTLNYTGSTIVQAGVLVIAGNLSNTAFVEVQSGGTLNLTGVATVSNLTVRSGGTLTGNGTLNGPLVNQGLVAVTNGTLRINGSVNNTGTLRVTGGASLNVTGTFTNNGVLDVMTAGSALPASFVNNGVVLTASDVRPQNVVVNGSQQVVITIQSYVGHNYQLQRAASLTASWTSVGSAQAGTGGVLSFSDPSSPGAAPVFYRIFVSP